MIFAPAINSMKMMFTILLYSACLWMSSACSDLTGNDPKLIPIGPLPNELTENSGLAMIGPDDYVGLNDSGHEAKLYVFSMHRKSGTRTVEVTNATNVDWEEMTTDDTYIYIADSGNNSGNRKDLCIYRVRIDDVKKKSEITADKLSFSYPDQTSFKGKKHNFDCEAMICVEDSLYLFTKNRGDLKTNVYSLLKVPGDHRLVRRGSFEAGGLVTGAAYRNKYGPRELVLIGYNNKQGGYTPFMYHFTDVPGTAFFSSPYKRVNFTGSTQIESVIFKDVITAYITNEEEHGDQGLVFKVALHTVDQ